jgi:hypothetical protein
MEPDYIDAIMENLISEIADNEEISGVDYVQHYSNILDFSKIKKVKFEEAEASGKIKFLDWKDLQ